MRLVFWSGPPNQPGVLVMHELPGLTKETIAFADRLVRAGYRVFLPLLFGKPMASSTITDSMVNYARLCMSVEFGRLAGNVTAPVTAWLRLLATDISGWCNDGRIGAVGMCLTGGFVIPLMLEPVVGAPVTSQPAIPRPRLLTIPIIAPKSRRSELNVSRNDLARAAEAAKTRDLTLVGFRFTGDWRCPAERFGLLRSAFRTRFDGYEFPTPDERHGLKRSAHSVLTYEYPATDEDDDHPSYIAMRKVLEFFARTLRA
jgi:dienelactone hydrolase